MIVWIQIWRNLNIHSPTENEPCCCNSSGNVGGIRFGTTRHPGSLLGSEILNDDLLDMPVAFMQVPDRDQSIDPLFGCFADPNQNSRRERYGELPGFTKHTQPNRWML